MSAAYRNKMRAQGRCITCGAEPKPGCVTCVDCITSKAEQIEANQARNRAAGRCACGREPSIGRKQCDRCRERKLAWWTANYSKAAREAKAA